jgi:hypothetical protein
MPGQGFDTAPDERSIRRQRVDDIEPIGEQPEPQGQAMDGVPARSPDEGSGVAIAALGADPGHDPQQADHDLVVVRGRRRSLQGGHIGLQLAFRRPPVEVGVDGLHRGKELFEVASPSRDPTQGRRRGRDRRCSGCDGGPARRPRTWRAPPAGSQERGDQGGRAPTSSLRMPHGSAAGYYGPVVNDERRTGFGFRCGGPGLSGGGSGPNATAG